MPGADGTRRGPQSAVRRPADASTLRLDGDRISDVSFEGSGCAISMASASLMTEASRAGPSPRPSGSVRAHARAADRATTRRGRAASASSRALSGVREFPARVKCASLCWHTLNAALHRRTVAGLDRVIERAEYHVCSQQTTNRSSSSADVDAVIVPAGVSVKLRPGQQRLHHARRSAAASPSTSRATCSGSPARTPTRIGKEAAACRPSCRRMPPTTDVQRARLAADEDLLRPGDPDQHRRPRAGLRLRRHARRRWHARVEVQDDADRARLRHGRRAGRRTCSEKVEHDPDREARPTSNWCSTRRGTSR